MRVLVGGGTGFVGRAFTQLLRSRGHDVTLISRHPGKGRITWDEVSRLGLPPCEGAVNLAGENVLNPLRRWNESFRQEVVASRIETTNTLAKAIAGAECPPCAWILVTGVGYYRPSHTTEYTEESPGGDFDFFSRLVTRWEAAAKIPGDATRQVVVRSADRGNHLQNEDIIFYQAKGVVGKRGLHSIERRHQDTSNLSITCCSHGCSVNDLRLLCD